MVLETSVFVEAVLSRQGKIDVLELSAGGEKIKFFS